jgi:hypothetical protein
MLSTVAQNDVISSAPISDRLASVICGLYHGFDETASAATVALSGGGLAVASCGLVRPAGVALPAGTTCSSY